jgi:formylglycine-generating enzyme required for sulfatase activity
MAFAALFSRFACAVLLAALFVASAAARADEHLVALARVGPWPAVSALVGFSDRLWFVNSVKFRDHNSADVYSYEPKTGAVRYERHLFSQDAGQPAVANGLLYWPFEDARFSVGQGEFMVTNGRDWRWRSLMQSRVLHLHQMFAHGGALYAATGGFNAGLYRSTDAGLNWRLVYQHQNAPNSYSRLVSLGALGAQLYAGLDAGGEPGPKLLRLQGESFAAVPGWPDGERADALTSFRGWLYALASSGRGTQLWRTDGKRSEAVRGIADTGVRALAAGPGALWAVSASGNGGALWQSSDGVSWRVVQRFAGDTPVDVAAYAGRVYIGAIGADGRGVLYGPAAPAPAATPLAFKSLPADAAAPEPDWQPALEALDRALAGLQAFEAGGGSLVRLLDPLIATHSPAVAQALAQRLARTPRDATTARLAGRRVPAADKADWQLLWAIARLGHGRIPPAMLGTAFNETPHRSEKYAAASAAAAWAVGELGQNDDSTLESLIARLERRGDPLWLTGDMVGALTALTGCRFGYDAAAWRTWQKTGANCKTNAAAVHADLISIPGGTFTLGDALGEPDETPRRVSVQAFRLMKNEVSNREFTKFVAASGHVTDAERSGSGYVWTGRWQEVSGADWRHPQGPKSTIAGLDQHPVVQVSARDAAAYCAWRGLRLPSEEEWEFAARGTDGRRFAWGNAPPRQSGARRANFGAEKCCAPDGSDGFARTAPIGSYPPGASPFGLNDMAGNVWEWTSSAYSAGSGDIAIRGGGWGNDPYCLRASYRHGNPPDIGLDMVGLRCAGD